MMKGGHVPFMCVSSVCACVTYCDYMYVWKFMCILYV